MYQYRQLAFIVFDEVHFFCSDATFNVETAKIFEALINTFPLVKRIYMSATSEDVKPLFFNEWDEIVDRIKCQDSDERWLIFVSSRKDGYDLQKKMKGISKFIDATYKDLHSEEIQKLARLKRFEEKVLIATTVLYNGFSFSDDTLRNIAVDTIRSC